MAKVFFRSYARGATKDRQHFFVTTPEQRRPSDQIKVRHRHVSAVREGREQHGLCLVGAVLIPPQLITGLVDGRGRLPSP